MRFDEVTDYTSVPPGTYRCKVVEVRTGLTRAGDERWSLRLQVDKGEHAGKVAAWDSLVFSVRGRVRARMVLGALGVTAKHIQPGDVEGRQAMVEVRAAEYLSADGSAMVKRNEVPYDGYRPVET